MLTWIRSAGPSCVLSLQVLNARYWEKHTKKSLSKLLASTPTVFSLHTGYFLLRWKLLPHIVQSIWMLLRIFFKFAMVWVALDLALAARTTLEAALHCVPDEAGFPKLPLICEGCYSCFLSIKICLHVVSNHVNLPWGLSPWSICLGSCWILIILPLNEKKKSQ